MHYYNEEKMGKFRIRLEKEILRWPEVSTKKMYGCPCYKRQEKLFAFLVTDGVVLTKAGEEDKTMLSKEFQIKPFQAANRTMRGWLQIPLGDGSDLRKILLYIEKSYHHS